MANMVIFGAGGKLGSRLVVEAASRGHKVRAVARDLKALQTFDPAVKRVSGDVTSAESVEALAADADVLVSAVGGPDKTVYLKAAQTLVSVVARRNNSGPRIFHSGGAGSLLNNEGVRLVDTPAVPEPFRDEMLGQAAALDFYRKSAGVSWTYLSPPPFNFTPGQRTGAYRLGIDHPVHGADGEMGISYEDYAVAVVDEIERPRHLNSRFTVGY